MTNSNTLTCYLDNLIEEKKKISLEVLDVHTDTHMIKMTIIRHIGQGAFGTVYEAYIKEYDQKYAVKIVNFEQKFKQREISILKMIDHPNIVKLKDYFYYGTDALSPSHIGMIMELSGVSMDQIVRINYIHKQYPPEFIIEFIMYQVFKGLSYLHAKGICHRDIKPQNILINQQNYKTQICDFGTAKLIYEDAENMSYMCSRYYRAPELLLGWTHYGTEIDAWAAGCVLAEFYTGYPIFIGRNSSEQLYTIINYIGTPSSDLYDYSTKMIPSCIKPLGIKNIFEDCAVIPPRTAINMIECLLVHDGNHRLRMIDGLDNKYFEILGQTRKHLDLLKGNPELIPVLIEMFDSSEVI